MGIELVLARSFNESETKVKWIFKSNQINDLKQPSAFLEMRLGQGRDRPFSSDMLLCIYMAGQSGVESDFITLLELSSAGDQPYFKSFWWALSLSQDKDL